jgi:8-oxo-dGTP pyrophosphatase MutT (NUDIX family)
LGADIACRGCSGSNFLFSGERVGASLSCLRSDLLSRTASRVSNIQYGALPWRRSPEGLRVLLITTRNTRRWIVPKGWPVEGLRPHEAAALEAFEEAGVRGNVGEEMLGSFNHRKQLKTGEVVACRVHVYALEVTEAHAEWVEKNDREIQWCSIEEALAQVSDAALRRLIVKFAHLAAAHLSSNILDASA